MNERLPINDLCFLSGISLLFINWVRNLPAIFSSGLVVEALFVPEA
jgi:hypothetical protein